MSVVVVGLNHRTVPLALLERVTIDLAQRIMDKPRAVIAGGKAFFYRQLEAPAPAAYADASRQITADMLADAAGEGVTAFIEKRKPRWD